MTHEPNIFDDASAILKKAEISHKKIKSIERINGSGNNQIYLLYLNESKIILKKYFQSVVDDRDRINSEYNFLKIAHSATPDLVPKPLAKDTDRKVALYEYISGKKFITPMN